jgi:UDP-glucose 4-epimerase
MKVLVTGGAGFIGSHVVDIMIEAGHQVSIVDSLWKRGGGRLENVNPKAQFYIVDVRDSGLADVFEAERPEVVCHLAAQHSVALSTELPAYDAQVNVLGLVNLLENCVRYRARKVVFASSAATYGMTEQMPVDEETPQLPESPYGITKMASEHYLRCWKKMYGLEYTILRFGNVYGPRQDPSGEAGVIAIFTNAILHGEAVRIDWDGEQSKDYVYVRDIARANLLTLTQGDGEIYCVATGQGTSVNALYQHLTDVTGNLVDVVRAPKRPGDIRQSVFDCSKAERELGWKAEIGLREGLQLTVDHYRQAACLIRAPPVAWTG